LRIGEKKMQKINLDKIVVSNSPLTGEIYIYRVGKNTRLALDKRIATHEVLSSVVGHMMHNSSSGACATLTLGHKSYKLSVTPIDKNKEKET
jgi:hypothetical protein